MNVLDSKAGHTVAGEERFGKLVVLSRFSRPLPKKPDGKSRGTQIIANCRCDCGVEIQAQVGHLKSGHTTSCGCYKPALTHGMNGTPTHCVWEHIRGRTCNPNNDQWKDYGGRGITCCERWASFEAFYEDMAPRPHGHTIERIDNDKGYYKENCRWATKKEQMENTRSNRWITFRGEKMLLRDWAKRIGVKQNTLIRRLALWPLERALTEPAIKSS